MRGRLRRWAAISGLCLLLVLGRPVSALAQAMGMPVNTATITAATTVALPACMLWMPIGICFWLSCNWTGCTIRTSPKVGHYNPDFVVSAYRCGYWKPG